jgi:hypothetical protein
MSVQSVAAGEYALLAARALETREKATASEAARLINRTFIRRRSPVEAATLMAKLKKEGWSPAQRRVLLENGYDESDQSKYLSSVLASAPESLGISVGEVYLEIARYWRDLGRVMRDTANSRPHVSPGKPVAFSYLVGNPHDKAETIDLFIRRASIPPDWKLSVVDAEPGSDGKAQKHVQQIVAGRHYRVQLQANGSTTVASVVVPRGVLPEGTTARWAVEGRIGDELIGGMVHELSVPLGAASSGSDSQSATATVEGNRASTAGKEMGSLVVTGTGAERYQVLDSAATKGLTSYRATNSAVELLPGTYVVELNGTRQRVAVTPGKQAAVAAGSLMATGTGAERYQVLDSAATKGLTSYRATNSAVELLPGTYVVELN